MRTAIYRIAGRWTIGPLIFSIYNMPQSTPDYFRYFTPTAERLTWGVSLTAAGFTRIAPRVSYPPSRHPADHAFSWERGRVLEALQIVLITEGRGQLELRGAKLQTIEAGGAFIVLPKIWHRYRPDPATGWTESWLEAQGPVVDSLLAKGVFAVDSVVRPDAVAAGLDGALAAIHSIAREAGPGFDPELAARTFGVLAAWVRAGEARTEPTHVRRAVLAAERRLAEHYAEPVNVEALAAELGVAYSHFRRAFLKHTGFSPWKYVVHLRLSQARRLLAASDATLDDLASRLGFSSGFHLSSAFKQAYGASPDRWRRKMQAGPGRAGADSRTRD